MVVARIPGEPKLPSIRSAWKRRQGSRASPLLLIVEVESRPTVVLCGPSGDDPPTFENVDAGQAERIAREALEQTDRHAALRYLRDALPTVESKLSGIRNEGFLATHELLHGARSLRGWADADRHARPVTRLRGHKLLEALGYRVDHGDRVTSILRIREGDRKVAVAVLLESSEAPDLSLARFGDTSPISYALSVADRENLPYVLVVQGSKLRLYPVRVGVGVGRRGRTETYVEVHTSLLRDSDSAYLWLLLSADALMDGGSLDQLLNESRRFAGDLAARLRERIYGSVIPRLAEGIAVARGVRRSKANDLAETYEMAMTVLFRLLFIAYAEDKDLLPYHRNGLYKSRSIKAKAEELRRIVNESGVFDDGDHWWREVDQLFRAVEDGNREWGIPKYDGGLFSRDPDVSPVGAKLAAISLPNTIFGPALCDLLLTETPEGQGPVDFRSLGVREFGTIYEGLLESELGVAESDLAIDKEGLYRNASKGEAVIVEKGRTYLHNRSGARKSSGSYFTKDFAVEHLLEKALTPALVDHVASVDAIRDDDEAAERYFDFRVADIAMGSGHFLVAAIDHVERALSGYLTKRPLPAVRTEIARLKSAALDTLGNLAEQVEIEDTQLLRRLIARRCIYGVDVNPVAVQLARVSIWIHTFVPGLPLSLLDHNLVVGNSLVGIGQVDELRKLIGGDAELFKIDSEALLGEATEPLATLAKLADTTAVEIAKARSAVAEARKAAAPAEALFDLATAARLRGEPLTVKLDDWQKVKETLVGSRAHAQARRELAHLAPFHFPVAFPEVFLRDRAGFDVILGNPPWQEATLEEHAFWARHVPGLRGLNQREQEAAKARLREERKDLQAAYEKELAEAEATRRALTTGPFPGMGTGDPDLYKAFCWRFWSLVVPEGGRIAVVLPRSALCAKGSQEFRESVFSGSDPVNVTMLLNTGGWVFDEAEPRYTIGLVAIHRAKPTGKSVRLLGPFASYDRFREASVLTPSEFEGSEVTGWTDSASLPLLPTEMSLEVFTQLRKSPKLGLDDSKSWRARPHTELHATNDKSLMDLESKDCPKGFWPVFKGESFDLWDPDTGSEHYYAWANPEVVIPVLETKRLSGLKRANSPFREFSPSELRNSGSLPCLHPRVAFRDVARATDSRTIIAALLPPRVFLTNVAPYFLWPRGDEVDQAFLLGVLSSLPLDWYARRFVELHVNFYVLNPFPIPRPLSTSQYRKRVVELAGRLACPDPRFADWAKRVGVGVGPLPSNEKQDMICELDAVVAHLYGLTERQLSHVFETFHEGWDFEELRRATLKHFKAWRSRDR